MVGKKVFCFVNYNVFPILIRNSLQYNITGQGLGKNEDGLSVPLKANLKFDQAGLGHSMADELNNHWWERVYNSASQNVDVNKNDGDVTMKLKTGKSIEVKSNALQVV